MPDVRRGAPRARPSALVAAGLAALLGTTVAFAGPPASQPVSDPVAQLEAMQATFAELATRVGPSVVAITAKRRLSTLWGGSPYATPGDDDLRRDALDPLTPTAGSGMVLRADGLILTNQHVVQDAEEIAVMLQGGRELPARVVGSDPRSDLAVLKIEADQLRPIPLAPQSSIRRGHWAIAMGNPYGITSDSSDGQASMTIGVVSAVGRRLLQLGLEEDRYYGNLVQTSAPIHQGNSGGPLLNIKGEAIGLITAIKSKSGSGEGFGFAIPFNPRTLHIVDQLAAGKTIEYGYLGVDVTTATPAERKVAGAPEDVGVLIDGLDATGPAVAAGLQKDDVVVRYAGQPVSSNEQFVELVGSSAVHEPVDLEVMRAGQKLTLTARPTRREPPQRRVSAPAAALTWRGLKIASLSAAQRSSLGVPADAGGVLIVGVEPRSAGEKAGLKPGMVLLAIEDVRLETPGDVARLSEKFDEAVRLKVHGTDAVLVLGVDSAPPPSPHSTP